MAEHTVMLALERPRQEECSGLKPAWTAKILDCRVSLPQRNKEGAKNLLLVKILNSYCFCRHEEQDL